MPLPRRICTLLAAALALGGCSFEAVTQWQASPADTAKTAATPTPPPPAAAKVATVTNAPAPEAAAPRAETRKPFVVIRFEAPDPDYGAALYDALSGALKRRPEARFDVVAVTRDADAAERNLAQVVHTITAMGMPSERLSLSAAAAADDATDEVWIYLR